MNPDGTDGLRDRGERVTSVLIIWTYTVKYKHN